MSYPDSTDKLNQLDVRYANINKDFAQDTLTFPADGSTALTTLLTEDNQLSLRDTRDVIGVNTVYHAQSVASNIIAQSRREVYDFTTRPAGFIYEPGDVLRLVDDLAGIDVFVKILTTRVNEQLNVEMTAIRFDPDDYGWRIQNIENVDDPTDLVSDPGAPASVTTTYDAPTRSVVITWTPNANEDVTVNGYIVEFSDDSRATWTVIANVLQTPQRAVHTLPTESATAFYRVRSKTSDERRSAATEVAVGLAVNGEQSFFNNFTIYFAGAQPPRPSATTVTWAADGATTFTPPTGWFTDIPDTTDEIWVTEGSSGRRGAGTNTVSWRLPVLFRPATVTAFSLGVSGGAQRSFSYFNSASTTPIPAVITYAVTATPSGGGSSESATFSTGTIPSVAYSALDADSIDLTETLDSTNSFTVGNTEYTLGFLGRSKTWSATVTHDSGAEITLLATVLLPEDA